jgi:hypothetical protein
MFCGIGFAEKGGEKESAVLSIFAASLVLPVGTGQ